MAKFIHSLFVLSPTLVIIVSLIMISTKLCNATDTTISGNTTTYNILSFGAKPNGLTDSTDAFSKAWNAACESDYSAHIYVPKGRYLLQPLAFEGDKCKCPHFTFQIDGTLVAPFDYKVLGGVDHWLSFKSVNGLDIIGGALDARGSALWACKAASTSCPDGATSLSITYSENVRVERLLSLNSQMFHIVVNHCQNVEMRGVRVLASGESPNTDGIHVEHSTNVVIFNSSIRTGDDCVSIGPGTQNLWIQRMACGPGHGISIGSLAKDIEEEGVQNVTVKDAVFKGTQNGLRIKTWARPSNGFVKNVHFQNVVINNVKNPIIIDQNYCPDNINCPSEASGVKISDVKYKSIKGTSTTEVAVKFDCSVKNPCDGISLEDINLSYKDQEAKSLCANAVGKIFGTVLPDSCF